MQGASEHMGGIQTYGRCPNIWGHPNIHGPPREAGFATSIYYFGEIEARGIILQAI